MWFKLINLINALQLGGSHPLTWYIFESVEGQVKDFLLTHDFLAWNSVLWQFHTFFRR